MSGYNHVSELNRMGFGCWIGDELDRFDPKAKESEL